MTTDLTDVEALEGNPPSVLLVALVLSQADEPLPRAEISRRSKLKKRTARYALERLRDEGLLTEQIDPHNPPRHTYDIDI